MIIWSGFGFLVAVIGFGSALLTEYVSENISGDGQYFQQHASLLGVAMLLAAALNYGLHRLLRLSRGRVVDSQSGQGLVMCTRHSLFFVPVKWWTTVFVVLAAGLPVLASQNEAVRNSRREVARPGPGRSTPLAKPKPRFSSAAGWPRMRLSGFSAHYHEDTRDYLEMVAAGETGLETKVAALTDDPYERLVLVLLCSGSEVRVDPAELPFDKPLYKSNASMGATNTAYGLDALDVASARNSAMDLLGVKDRFFTPPDPDEPSIRSLAEEFRRFDRK